MTPRLKDAPMRIECEFDAQKCRIEVSVMSPTQRPEDRSLSGFRAGGKVLIVAMLFTHQFVEVYLAAQRIPMNA